jgi:hypothetical protein
MKLPSNPVSLDRKSTGINPWILIGALSCLTVHSLHAADFHLGASDASGLDSFDEVGNWLDSGNAAATTGPATGNDYFTGAFTLRTPNGSTSNFTFGGDSLTVGSGGSLLYSGGKGANTIEVNNLTLDGGSVISSGTNSTSDFTLSGSLGVTGNGGTLNSGSLALGIRVASSMSGSGTLNLAGTSIIQVTSGSNTFDGNITMGSGVALTLSSGANFNFTIGADGVNNTISGSGSNLVSFNGVFDLDLSGADTTIGNSWTLVDMNSVSSTFDPGTFAITGFTENNHIWTLNDFQFDESTGVLSVVSSIPEPSAYAMVFGAAALGFVALYRRRAV